jgi:hypothetical protein
MLWNSLFGYLMGGVNNAMYISDILIHSETEEEHLRHVKQVLATLEKHSMLAKIKKSECFQTSVEFL